MLDFEISQSGRFKVDGSDVLRIMQNKEFSLLDLLVREALQNCLDAGNGCTLPVKVGFQFSDFSSDAFAQELGTDCISAVLRRNRFSECKYLAISDYNTVGLTGPLDGNDVARENLGNLNKLVYNISKQQTDEGKGGSFGYGKSVFFLIGIGLVAYYSRIKQSDGRYESRFVVSLVEDASKADSLFAQAGMATGSGIALWGRSIGSGLTIPITDENQIARFLSVFHLDPYQNTQTGTTIIVPYVKESDLLKEVRQIYLDLPERFHNSIPNFLGFSIQKWYFPRLNNSFYPFGQYLSASINQRPISFEPFFAICQKLYNRAILDEDAVSPIAKTEIEMRKTFAANSPNKSKAGNLCTLNATPNQLHMTVPDNQPSPFKLLGIPEDEGRGHCPILMYTRKPGMILSFDGTSNSSATAASNDLQNYPLALFVPYSEAVLEEGSQKLEEYLRTCENSLHNNWVGVSSQSTAAKLKRNVASQLGKIFKPVSNVVSTSENLQLSKIMADLFLPPTNFGRIGGFGGRGIGGGSEECKESDGGSGGIGSGVFFRRNPVLKCKYIPDIGFPFLMRLPKDSPYRLKLCIKSEQGIIDYEGWGKSFSGIPFPVRIKRISFLEKVKRSYEEREAYEIHLGLVDCDEYGQIMVDQSGTELKFQYNEMNGNLIFGYLFYECEGNWEVTFSLEAI